MSLTVTNTAMVSSYDLDRPFTIILAARQYGTGTLRIITSLTRNSLISISRNGACVHLNGAHVHSDPLAPAGQAGVVGLQVSEGQRVQLFFDGNQRAVTFMSQPLWGIMSLGASGTESANADIFEIIVYDRVLTSTEHAAVAGYLQAKWFPDPE